MGGRENKVLCKAPFISANKTTLTNLWLYVERVLPSGTTGSLAMVAVVVDGGAKTKDEKYVRLEMDAN